MTKITYECGGCDEVFVGDEQTPDCPECGDWNIYPQNENQGDSDD